MNLGVNGETPIGLGLNACQEVEHGGIARDHKAADAVHGSSVAYQSLIEKRQDRFDGNRLLHARQCRRIGLAEIDASQDIVTKVHLAVERRSLAGDFAR